jgi:hypothetical protein
MSTLGCKHTEEWKRQASIRNTGAGNAMFGRKFTDEQRKRLSVAQKGRISWIKGGTHSEGTRKKMSIAHKRIGISAETRRKMLLHHKGGGMIGKKHSEETKRKMSVAATGKRRSIETRLKISKAKMNPDRALIISRHGGRRCIEHVNWSKEVKKRDGWKCRMSDEHCTGRIVAHHILPYAQYEELRYVVKNGITLCKYHHPRTRKTESQMSPYFQELVAQN